MGLVYEAALTSSDVSNKYVDVEDVVPDVMRGSTGYFCPSQEGILQSNERPPIAQDICWHKDVMFYSNTTGKNRVTARMLGVARAWVAATAYVVGDIVVNDTGKLYVCDTAGTSAGSGGPTGTGSNISDNTARWDYGGANTRLTDGDTITIDGTAYTAKNTVSTTTQFAISSSQVAQVAIQETTQNLIATVNAYASNSTVWAYYLSGPDDGAGIFMIEERGLADGFTVTSSRATCWSPQLGTLSSSDDDANNRLYISKPSQPEAVPLLNYIDVGSKGDQILRIIALRDSLYVFKEKEGIFRVTGDGPFAVREHDSTVRLIGKGTLAKLSNELYCFSNQGVVAISDVGVRIVSPQIQSTLDTRVQEATATATHKWSIAVGHQDLNLYIVALGGGDVTVAKFVYVYCPSTDAWTTWNLGTAAIGPCIMAIDPATPNRLVWATTGEAYLNVEIRQGGIGTDFLDFGTAIAPSMTWLPIDAGMPGNFKQWTRADFLLAQSLAAPASSLVASFSNDHSTSTLTSTFAPSATAKVISTPIPVATQLGSALTVNIASGASETQMRVVGLVLTYEEASDWAGG
jgi:hypothetical protein